MRNEQLFISDDCFAFLRDQELLPGLTKLVEMFREFYDREIPIVLTTNYWDLGLPSGQLMYQLLYDEDFPIEIPHELRKELMIHLDRCELCETQPINTTITCGDFSRTYLSGCFVVAKERSESDQIFPMFFDLPENLHGKQSYLHNEISVDCFFISRREQLPLYYRELMEIQMPKGSNFVHLAELAFPKLKFHPELEPSDLGIDLNLHFPTLIQHLTFLNDEFVQLGSKVKWDLPRLMQEARARRVVFSDESSNTKRDSKKMKHREKVFQGEKEPHLIIFSLHTKILPTEGRIHFHTPHPDFDDGVLIGIFAKHLPV